jgi:antitoxin component of MazEF toxin-antitoxin module
MRTRIRKVGKEHIVIVPKRMLSAVGLKTGGPVEMTAHRGELFVAATERLRRVASVAASENSKQTKIALSEDD